ncbi:FKBP-type peptidyl-prolyl cis-trans isomerase [Flavisolibacter nicotianae]|uniref:FKBP-type peptidyl-prolyl cis-trans isomerase n=1 Tax=Flavisolibacter nicotianae TaxID=2364882 RepID=UPI0013C51B42|nr:FKBP-type peptidyl-prolyl cis-trans isomerase [Flavisolibacter nicotianae]
MKKYLSFLLFLLAHICTYAAGRDSTVRYEIPDSVKAVSFLADVALQPFTSGKEVVAGIETEPVRLLLKAKKNKRQVVFAFPQSAVVVSFGLGTRMKRGELTWTYNEATNLPYKFMLASATDSAENFSLYSAYLWLPAEKKWKLIGTCKISGQWNTLKSASSFVHSAGKVPPQASITNAWCQRSNGTWKALDESRQASPVVNLASHVDSLQQFQLEKAQIEKGIAGGQTDVKNNIEGVYYTILRQGTGRQVALTDTVTVYYKGSLFSNGQVFDQTKDKPATFPLNRLIKGWQIAVPLLKVGGKIKSVIPSALAYSIRTRAAKIPPNSILVFEVEVLDAKPATAL